jgi:hypothetical protein
VGVVAQAPDTSASGVGGACNAGRAPWDVVMKVQGVSGLKCLYAIGILILKLDLERDLDTLILNSPP